jgi:hypothetical protein
MSCQVEQHTLTSLSNRLGVTRTATSAAIQAGRLKCNSTQAGQRMIYNVSTDAIEGYKSAFAAKLTERIARVTSDPFRQREMLSSAKSAALREALKESSVWSPQRLADYIGTSLERANWLLNRHAKRAENGFTITPEILAAIEAENNALRKSAPVRSSGI